MNKDKHLEVFFEKFNSNFSKYHNKSISDILSEFHDQIIKDNPVPSIDSVNQILHTHRVSIIGIESFRRLQNDMIKLFQNGVETDKEKPICECERDIIYKDDMCKDCYDSQP